ncbi:MAG: DUF1501 domain-containing protein [Verrucomicrobiota bacterium]|nr:DUF1501 domain-containing protein [Verrucomicrobiota bacterium]MCC6820228.1 DUF1501 domain-containing protein [Limisphaerales bacterium]
MSNPISRRGFIRQLNCAAVGSSAMLNTLLNLKLANSVAGQGGPLDNSKALVCIFLSGGMDSFNVLVPWEPSAYDTYSVTRGAFGTDGGLALDRNALRQLSAPSANYGLHPACANLQAMANGTGAFAGKRRLAFVSNVGTLVQPVTKAEFTAWENGQNAALPVPKALFSHSDQIEQWQTAVPQGMAQLSGWAGRCADILHSYYNTGANSMSISLGGNNVFQVGNSTHQFVVTPAGALSFEGDTGGVTNNPLQFKNAALRNTLDQHYTNLLTEGFAQLTKQSDAAQRLFQTQFDSANAQLGGAVDALFPAANYLATTLKAVVKTIKIRNQLGLKRQTFFVQYGGWDHHGELLNTQAGMLATLDTALGAYQQALEMLGLQNDVVSFTASDFSRTLRSNGRGTDHAWGANAMVLGGKVDGGKIFGTYPNLALDGPDDVGRGGRLLPSTSADAYFAELLRWFGVSTGNLSYVLPNIANFPTPLGFVLP